MEMLMKVLIGTVGFSASLCAMFFAWVGFSIVEMKTELAVTHEKVANVEKMVQPLWQEYVSEKMNAHFAFSDISTDK